MATGAVTVATAESAIGKSGSEIGKSGSGIGNSDSGNIGIGKSGIGNIGIVNSGRQHERCGSERCTPARCAARGKTFRGTTSCAARGAAREAQRQMCSSIERPSERGGAAARKCGIKRMLRSNKRHITSSPAARCPAREVHQQGDAQQGANHS